MKSKGGFAALTSILVVAAVAVAVFGPWSRSPRQAMQAVLPSAQALEPASGGSVRSFDLTAAPATLELRPGLQVPVWAYNGTVPGPELRVTTEDLVQVSFRNELPDSTTIHWHGVSLPNGEDGVAGVTQDPVAPGHKVTYAFVAPQPGTYWYHPHQNPAEQLDRGLYGALVVEAKGATKAGLDQVLVYDEWPMGAGQATPPPGDDATMMRYGVYSVNGKSGNGIGPIRFTPGQTIRLRLVNAGYLTHYLHIHGAPFVITGFDGSEVSGGPPTDHALPLAAGERLEVEFVAPAGPMVIRAHDPSAPAAQMRVPLVPVGQPVPAEVPGEQDSISGEVLDLYNYAAKVADPIWPSGTAPTKSFTLKLSELMGHARSDTAGMTGMSGNQTSFGINGKSFPDTANLEVSQGDWVQITFANEGRLEHPMHLHGHDFQLLSINGKPTAGVLIKDTVDVLPGSAITVGFVADNPGWWMLHCHELHHAGGGMDTLVRYKDAPRLAGLGGPFEGSPG